MLLKASGGKGEGGEERERERVEGGHIKRWRGRCEVAAL